MRDPLRLPHPKDAGQPTAPGLQEVVLEAIQGLLREELLLRLYGNDVTPAEGVTLASFVEISGRGYSPKVLSPALWSLNRTPEGWRLFKYGKQLFFEFDGTGVLAIYGYYVTRRKDGALMWADRLHPPGMKPLDYDIVRNPGDAIGFGLVVPVWVGGLGA